MTSPQPAPDPAPEPDQETAEADAGLTPLVVAGIATLGAGAIHAAAIGVHSEDQAVVRTFALLAAFQLVWGAAAIGWRERRPWFLAVGAIGSAAAVGGWLLAKTTGIGFISGLAESESVQLADAAAAALAFGAGLLVVGDLLVPSIPGMPVRPSRRGLVPLVAVPVMVLTVASMVSAGSHSHAGGHAHGETASGHDHGVEAAVNPGPFDPEQTVDLSGVPGISPEEQAEAEDLVERTLDRLPQFDDLATLNDRGFYSIGDAVTGSEHYVNWAYVDDDRILDPDYPESLVIQRDENGERYLAAAMFMLPTGTTLDEVPDVGGDLVQWHVHADLCFTDDPVAPTLAFGNLGVGVEGECTPPNSKRGNVPMIHVWIVPHPCGPFAALEGVGGGQVAEGEEHICTEEHAHVGEG